MRQRRSRTEVIHRYLLLLFSLSIVWTGSLAAQPITDSDGDVGIGTTTPDPSARLDLQSTSGGFLMPRMTTDERDAIDAPANGLIIYNTESGTIEIWSNASGSFVWDALVTTGSNTAWLTGGNAGLTEGLDNMFGTLDLTDIDIRTNNLTAMTISGADQSVAVTGNLSATGTMQIDGNLNADGMTTLDVTMVEGAFSQCGGTATFGGTIDAMSGADITGTFSLAGGASPLNVNGSDGALGNLLISGGPGVTPAWTSPDGLFWTVQGNGGTTPGTNFMGTTDNAPLHIRTDNTDRMIFNTDGSIQRDAGGDTRGSNAIDLQTYRTDPTQVASGSMSTIAGGQQNSASGNNASIGGGAGNVASGTTSNIGGGAYNETSGLLSFIGGGGYNVISGYRSVIGGGYQNSVSGNYAFIGSGLSNSASGNQSMVIGGNNNEAAGLSATVGGERNIATGDYGTIPGGRGLTLEGDRSFGFLANGGLNNMTVEEDDVAVIGNADLWLASNNERASQVRFYESNSTNGTFPPAGINYSSFEAAEQTEDINYVLPYEMPYEGDVLVVEMIDGSTVHLVWAESAGGSTARRGDNTPTSIAPIGNEQSAEALRTQIRGLRQQLEMLQKKIDSLEEALPSDGSKGDDLSEAPLHRRMNVQEVND